MKLSQSMIIGVNFLYHETNCSIARIARHYKIAPATVNKLLLTKADYLRKCDEESEDGNSTKLR